MEGREEDPISLKQQRQKEQGKIPLAAAPVTSEPQKCCKLTFFLMGLLHPSPNIFLSLCWKSRTETYLHTMLSHRPWVESHEMEKGPVGQRQEENVGSVG